MNEKNVEDFIELSKDEFLKKYNYINQKEYQNMLDIMWQQLSDIPVDETGTFIEDFFYKWQKGDKKEDIWHWFDERVIDGIGNKYFN